MLSGRPLLYFSLPGVAFILGVFWYRRRNKANCKEITDTDTDTLEITNNSKSKKHIEANKIIHKQNTSTTTNGNIPPNNKTTQSMNINGKISNHHKHGQPDDRNNIGIKQFGKSAPINIVTRNSSGRSPINKAAAVIIANNQSNPIDSEVLASKIQDAEHKLLRSIDEDFENLSSSVDLPDSCVNNHRIPFYGAATRNINIKRDEPPIVIKATNTPKISPENSFLETKYVKSPPTPTPTNITSNNDTTTTNEQNNNNVIKLTNEEINATSTNNNDEIKKEETKYELKEQQKQQENIITEDEEEDVDVEAENITIINNNTEKRKLDVASPSLSLCSLQSGDSGKGSSLPRSEATRAKTRYEFLFPIHLLCHLYGRRRSFINQLKLKTSVNITLSHKALDVNLHKKVCVCILEGSESEINAALQMIRQRLPLKHHPNFTMERIHYALPQTIVPLSTESLLNLQLKLIEGINNDVVVSTIVSGGHLFVQQPLHPSHPSLAILQRKLYESYISGEAPLLPSIEVNAVCVTCVNGIWYRVQIVEADSEDNQRCIVKFLDFGGYMNVNFNDLRQIRTDFMSVPFQATECILSNIEPIADNSWTLEAADILSKLTKGVVLQAQVAGYNVQNIPEIYLFVCLGPNNVIFINKELVARNLAKWVEIKD